MSIWVYFFKKIFGIKEVKEKITSSNYIKAIDDNSEIYINGNGDASNLKVILDISKEVPKTLSIDSFKDKCTKVSFLFKTSHGLLDTVSKQQYGKSTLLRSNYIDGVKNILPLNEWWSNDESIIYFIIFMEEMLENEIGLLEETIEYVDQSIDEFLNSYLYRILKSDYIELLKILIKEFIIDENT